jgi:hypothetical protein
LENQHRHVSVPQGFDQCLADWENTPDIVNFSEINFGGHSSVVTYVAPGLASPVNVSPIEIEITYNAGAGDTFSVFGTGFSPNGTVALTWIFETQGEAGNATLDFKADPWGNISATLASDPYFADGGQLYVTCSDKAFPFLTANSQIAV